MKRNFWEKISDAWDNFIGFFYEHSAINVIISLFLIVIGVIILIITAFTNTSSTLWAGIGISGFGCLQLILWMLIEMFY